MSEPRIRNIQSFPDINREVSWIHTQLTELNNLIGSKLSDKSVDFTNLTVNTLKVKSGADDAILNAGGITQKDYISQSKGYRITADGQIDCRYLYTNELHAKAFVADLEQALAGGQIICKSVAKLMNPFVLPTAGNTGRFTVEEFAEFSGNVFADGDMIRLRQMTRSGNTTVTVADAWGTVVFTRKRYWGNTLPLKIVQEYTFTRSAGATAGTATGTIVEGSLALDYGVTGQGYYEVTAIDGANGANSPYAQVVTWTTHPQNGCTVKSRFGNLSGITSSSFGALSGYGLYGNRIYLEGDCYIAGVITLVAGSSGELSLTGGAIAGMTISSTALTATADGKQTIVSSGATAFSAGTTATPEFKVTSAGALTATSATIKTNTDVGNLKRVEIRSSDNELCFYEATVADPIVRIGSDVNGTTDGIYVKNGAIYSLSNIATATVYGWNIATSGVGGSFWATGAGGGTNNALYAWAANGSYNYALNCGNGDVNIASTFHYKVNGTNLAALDIGATTVGKNIFELTNPSAITFLRINANNTVSALSAGDFRTATESAYTIHNLIDTTNHPVTGLTTGHFLKAASATTYGFAAHGLTYADVGAAPSTQGAVFAGTISSGFWVATSSGGATTAELPVRAIVINSITHYCLE